MRFENWGGKRGLDGGIHMAKMIYLCVGVYSCMFSISSAVLAQKPGTSRPEHLSNHLPEQPFT